MCVTLLNILWKLSVVYNWNAAPVVKNMMYYKVILISCSIGQIIVLYSTLNLFFVSYLLLFFFDNRFLIVKFWNDNDRSIHQLNELLTFWRRLTKDV